MSPDPERLVDLPEIDSELRAALATAARVPWVDFDADAGAERLLAATTTPAPGSPGTRLRLPWARPLTVGLGVALLAGAAFMARPAAAPVPAHAPPAAVSSAAVVPLPPSPSPSPLDPPPPPSMRVEDLPAVEPVATARPVTVTTSGEGEVEQLERVRRLLAVRPADAAQAAREGHRAFPDGALYPEREVLLIEGLARSGQREEAAARGRTFVLRYSRSPLVERVRETAGL